MSDSLRPPTASGRPSTASRRTRPTTSSSQRPDTAASSISSLGPAPHTFRPDLDDFEDDEDELAEGSESEAEDGVFAFHRPATGAVPGLGAADALSPISQGGGFSQPPTTAGQQSQAGTYGGPPPSTAQFSVAPPSLSFSHSDTLPSGQTQSGPATTYSPYSSNDLQSGSDFSQDGGLPSPTALAPVQFVHARDGESYGAASPKRVGGSDASSSASYSAGGGDSTLGQQPVRMRSFAPLMEAGGRRRRSVKYAETEPGSDEGTGIESWRSQSLAGPTTIPHGVMEQHYEDEYEKCVESCFPPRTVSGPSPGTDDQRALFRLLPGATSSPTSTRRTARTRKCARPCRTSTTPRCLVREPSDGCRGGLVVLSGAC